MACVIKLILPPHIISMVKQHQVYRFVKFLSGTNLVGLCDVGKVEIAFLESKLIASLNIFTAHFAPSHRSNGSGSVTSNMSFCFFVPLSSVDNAGFVNKHCCFFDCKTYQIYRPFRARNIDINAKPIRETK